MKRIASFFLVVVLIFTAIPMAAFGADNPSVAQQAADLESKYGITISYSTNSSGEPSITTANLNTLDRALANVTPAAVRQVSSYYRNKTGSRINVAYVRSGNMGEDSVTMANFYPDTAKIEIYIPTGSGTVRGSGDSPINIVHEFGHAVHLMYTDSYGFDRMEQEWSGYNNGIRYSENNIRQNPDEKVFASGYGATSFAEDVAEIIGHAFIRSQAGQGMKSKLSTNGIQTDLGKKVAYVEKMLASCIDDSDAMIANYRRVYTAETTVSYQSLKFSGDYLQYAGYDQPQYVLNGTLNSMNLKKDKAAWIQALGGWYVKTTAGNEMIVFPGGVWCEVGKNFVAPI